MATRENRVAIMVTTLPAGDHLSEKNGPKCPTMATTGCHENGLPCRVAMPVNHKKSGLRTHGGRLGRWAPSELCRVGFKTKSFALNPPHRRS